MRFRHDNSSRTSKKTSFNKMAGMLERIAKSKKAFALVAAMTATSCSLDRSVLDRPIDVQISDANVEVSSEDRPAMPNDSGVVIRPNTDASILDVRQMPDTTLLNPDTSMTVDVPLTVDVPIVVDVPRPTDTNTDVLRPTDSVISSGCSRCVNGTFTYSFGYPTGNSTVQNGYSFVRPLPEARLRVNCAVSGNLVCEQSFSAVGQRQTCSDGPNTITMTYNSTGSGQQRYVVTVACH